MPGSLTLSCVVTGCLCHLPGWLTPILWASVSLSLRSFPWSLSILMGALLTCFSLALSFFFFWPHGLQDLTSLTRDWTPGPQQWNHTVLTTGPPGKSPSLHVSTASSLSCPAAPILDGKCFLKCLPLWLSCELSEAWCFAPGCTSSAQCSATNTVGAEYSLVKWLNAWMKALRVSIFRPGVTRITSEPSWFTGRSLIKLAFHCSLKIGLLQTISLLF